MTNGQVGPFPHNIYRGLKAVLELKIKDAMTPENSGREDQV